MAVPLFADQFENSRRIAASGAALIVEGRREQDGRARALMSDQDALSAAAAIDTVLGDPAYRLSASVIGAEMAAMPTADAVVGQVPSAR